MSTRVLPALLGAALAGTAAHAETLHVIEQLVVNVNSAPDASGERIATVKSGESVEVLDRQGEQVHVRLAGGRDGWIRASYLSAGEPLRGLVAQRDAQLAQLQEQLTQLRSQLAAAGAPAAVAAAAPAPLATATATASASASAAAPEDSGAPTLFGAAATPLRPAWPWTLAAALLGLGLGFALGALALDRHIRRKYGGLRIY
jgi:hypothetical protein